MIRLVASLALVWGLISCQPGPVVPGSSEPTLPAFPTAAPGRPSPTIEIPPPI